MSNQGFDPKDVAQIMARKPVKYRMTKSDYKELGVNLVHGIFSVATGVMAVGGSILTAGTESKNNQDDNDKVTFKTKEQGTGYYYQGYRIDDEE